MFEKILVVCTGNICRSPFGEALLKKLKPELDVSSAGVGVESNKLAGLPADAMAVKVAAQYGVDISGHRSRQITQGDIDAVDVILVMERKHIDQLCELFPLARSKTILFGHWVGISTIDDPFRQGEAAFEHSFSLIENAAEAWKRKLS
ncbi:phosphotyrosine protein phosphatase [Vibrio sp. HA2012]|uniref:low molecular weight protein-tyrosine-phosphatase n=1 Tax=Vibrio sp. HA2012 TaxID=1971595 RepID=UPI000C2C6AF0|nr:low molecular weight protein-tyrosine-phosphatase [Vibrio sp. HA2012]PJC88028.1 phosphotyrosine protein phosphatase [Vibrio sp. HA2012]